MSPQGEEEPPQPVVEDAEIGTTKHTEIGTTKHTDEREAEYTLLGKDLVWNNVGLKLMEKNGDTKLNILQVSTIWPLLGVRDAFLISHTDKMYFCRMCGARLKLERQRPLWEPLELEVSHRLIFRSLFQRRQQPTLISPCRLQKPVSFKLYRVGFPVVESWW